MDRNQAKELLPIIKAFSEGKAIESRYVKGGKALWYDDEDLSFDNDFEYRIKSESKYRPFANAEECWQEMQKHQPFGWTYDYTNNIWDSIARVTGSGIIYEEDMMCFEDVFNREKFADGTPFGVKIEEE